MAGDRSGWNGSALGGRSRWADVDGPVHYLDFGGPARGPVIVCVHGLSGSAVNWAAIAPLLTNRYRLIAPDLAGHGLTRAAGRDTGVFANRALLHRFIESASARQPVILMGNSMGGMISLMEASASPETVAALILVDPALPFAFARPDPVVATLFALYGTPGLGGLLRSLRRDPPPDVQVARLLSLCCADPSLVSARTVAQHVEMARRRADSRTGARRSTTPCGPSCTRWARGAGKALPCDRRFRHLPGAAPAGVTVDRLVPVGVARSAARAHPDWTLAVLPGVGHVPQLEVPRETAELIIDWLGSDARPGADLADSGARAGSGIRAALATARGTLNSAVSRGRKSVRFRD